MLLQSNFVLSIEIIVMVETLRTSRRKTWRVVSKSLQKNVVNEFITIMYVDSDISEIKDKDYVIRLIERLSSLQSSNYNFRAVDMEWLSTMRNNLNENVGKYADFTVNNISKEKVNGKKVTVYNVDVDFLREDKTVDTKLLYIELIKENSTWKINNIMPRSE